MRKQRARVTFGKQIKEFRKIYGWTQSKLARKAKISLRHLQRIESKYPPDVTIDVLAALSRAFKLKCYKILARK